MKKIFFIIIIAAAVATGIYILNTTAARDLGDHSDKKQLMNTDTSKGNSSKNQSSFNESLSAESAILIDLRSGNILFEKNSRKRCYPASTTKILTALIAIENCKLNEKITVGNEADFPAPGSSKAGIRYGEKLTMEQLLNCMLIPSGNDAAYTIAVNVGKQVSKDKNTSARGAVQLFSELMNKKAKKLGAKDSKFVNPDGFHNDEHYTTAYDMSLIAREALKYKSFRDIVCKESFKIPSVRVKDKNGKYRSQARILINTNKLLLKNDPHYLNYVTGIKTGHTEQAGHCLVSSAKANGRSVLAVVMNSTEENVWSDSKELIEWGIKK